MTSSLIPPGHTWKDGWDISTFKMPVHAAGRVIEPVETTEHLILDLTASPEGNSTPGFRFHDRGLILANDGTSSRIPALTSTLKNWGAAAVPSPIFRRTLWTMVSRDI
jgi:hypothetical protein